MVFGSRLSGPVNGTLAHAELSRAAIFAQDNPALRSDSIWHVSTPTMGRPSRFPRARAAARPDRTH
jgi:hypothetical protein